MFLLLVVLLEQTTCLLSLRALAFALLASDVCFVLRQIEVSRACQVADFIFGPLVLLAAQQLITQFFAWGVRRSYPKGSLLVLS